MTFDIDYELTPDGVTNFQILLEDKEAEHSSVLRIPLIASDPGSMALGISTLLIRLQAVGVFGE